MICRASYVDIRTGRGGVGAPAGSEEGGEAAAAGALAHGRHSSRSTSALQIGHVKPMPFRLMSSMVHGPQQLACPQARKRTALVLSKQSWQSPSSSSWR